MGFLYAFGGKRTELNRSDAGEILALRRYLRSIDRPEAARLLKADPEYFYRMAPYAIALGVGKPFAAAFGRPAWDISFHVNMDAASLIGMDTFAGGQVVFRPGPVYRCAQCGGFGVLDEINMAKNEALAVLHAVLDFRRAIDVPGYDRIPLAEETRFIATMNYGYAGTRELNEALTSRFAVVQMPTITQDNLEKLLRAQFPDLAAKYVHQFALLFLDLQKKCDSAEISTKALDLRGMLDALRLIRRGIPAGAALDMGITNKAFDSYEQGLIRDVIAARIPAKLDAGKLFA